LVSNTHDRFIPSLQKFKDVLIKKKQFCLFYKKIVFARNQPNNVGDVLTVIFQFGNCKRIGHLSNILNMLILGSVSLSSKFFLFFGCTIICYVSEPLNATIGVLVPLKLVSSGGLVPLSFQQMATAMLLAIHHVNTRNGSIVGDTANQLPIGFKLFYKIADTNFAMSGGVKAILDWRAQEGYAGFASSCGARAIVSNRTTPQPLYAASSPADKIMSIVGPDLSEISQAVTVIAGIGGTPVTSYWSTSTSLSDKSKFPLFSRTVPVQSFNMLGMANIMAALGWMRCAVLFSDTEYGNSFASDFQLRAGRVGITILLLRKFRDKDAADIGDGAADLKRSGARVFVFLSQGATNLEAVLLGSRDAGIAGEQGYAWVAGELGNLNWNHFVDSSDLPTVAPKKILRPLFAGWLVLDLDALYGDRRAAFESAFAAADLRAVHDPLVNMPVRGLAPPRNV
jgi:hypothetical protein